MIVFSLKDEREVATTRKRKGKFGSLVVVAFPALGGFPHSPRRVLRQREISVVPTIKKKKKKNIHMSIHWGKETGRLAWVETRAWIEVDPVVV